MKEEKVKWPSKKVYPCKRNKGEHEWDDVEIKHKWIDYCYRSDDKTFSIRSSPSKSTSLKFVEATLRIFCEIKCIHCGKISRHYLSDKIK